MGFNVMTVKLRGHHLLCMLTYEGIGYTERFVRNFDATLRRIQNSEEIEIVEGPDDICAPLLSDENAVDGHCRLKRVERRDTRALEALSGLLGKSVSAGSHIQITASMLERLREEFKQGRIRSACRNCPWYQTCTESADTGFVNANLVMETSKKGPQA